MRLNTASAVTFVVDALKFDVKLKKSQYRLSSNLCGLTSPEDDASDGKSQYRLSSNLCGLCKLANAAVIRTCLNTASAVTFVVKKRKVMKKFSLSQYRLSSNLCGQLSIIVSKKIKSQYRLSSNLCGQK